MKSPQAGAILEMYVELINNAALLVALSALYSLVARLKNLGRSWFAIMFGVVFGAVAIAGMMVPYHHSPGIIYDGRSVIIAMAGLFGGWLGGGVAAGVATLYRLYLGGSGVLAGVASIVTSFLIGALFQKWLGERPDKLGVVGLLCLGITVHLVVLLCQLLLPWPMGINVIKRIALPIMLIFPLATLVSGLLLGNEEKRRWAEEALRKSEEQLRLAFYTSPDALVISRVENGVYVDINQGFTKISGYSREEVIGRSAMDINIWYDPRDRDRMIQGIRKHGKIDNLEARFRLKDGTVITGLISASVFVFNGEMHVLSITRNIEHLKELEKERIKLYEEAETARRLLSDVLSRISDGVVALDKSWVFTYVNEQAAKLLDRDKPGDLLDRHIWAEYPELVGHPFYEAYHKAMETQQAVYLEGYHETWDRWFENRIFPSPDGITVYFTEITERIRATEEKTKLEEQLRQAQKLESIGRLAGGVAHDFNNMLSIILGYSEDILQKLPPGDPIQDEVEEIISAGRRSADLTRQLLAFSRKQILRPKVLDLNDLMRNLERMLRRLIGEDIEMSVYLDSEPTVVEVDPGQFEQVIMNLVVNARDAMPGGGKLDIDISRVELDEEYAGNHQSVKPGRYILVAVSDTGTGMDKETMNKIFEPFFTTKGKGKGTGLGLSTVYGIIKQSGGNVWVYSESGRGTTFKIYLPEAKKNVENTKRPAPKNLKPGDGEHILVVEDEESLRRLAAKALTRFHYKVTVASSPAKALSLVEAGEVRPALLITDLVMPGMSGKELFDHLKEILPGIKVIYMSGYMDNAIMHHGVLDKGVQFIQKPFSLSSFMSKVQEVLEN